VQLPYAVVDALLRSLQSEITRYQLYFRSCCY